MSSLDPHPWNWFVGLVAALLLYQTVSAEDSTTRHFVCRDCYFTSTTLGLSLSKVGSEGRKFLMPPISLFKLLYFFVGPFGPCALQDVLSSEPERTFGHSDLFLRPLML